MSSPVMLRKTQVKRKPRFDDDDNENNENIPPQITNPFDDFALSQNTIDTTISFQKASCGEQSNSQASLTSARRRLQRISGKRQPLEIRYENEEEIKPIVKKEEEQEEAKVFEIEYSKPSTKIEAELDNKCSQSSVKPIITEAESSLIECEDKSEEVIKEKLEDIAPKKSLAEIPDLIRINDERKKTCYELTIQDVTIYFPYRPYKAQIEYMMQVIDALNKGENALLQSPSGTGKTLCLLCACFGWINKRREEYKASQGKFEYERNQIVLSTKTFAQINQIIEELSKTCYEPVKSILGSKTNLCVNKRVLKDETTSSINESCKIERLKNKCTYYSEYKQNRGRHLKMYEDTLPDIEELVTAAKNEIYCPFYLQQDLITLGRADLILLPHNYILEETTFKTTGLDLKNAILIFDDAHHIESEAEEGSSLRISLEALKEINFHPLKRKLGSGLIQTDGLTGEVLLGVETIIERMINRLETMKYNFEDFYEKVLREDLPTGITVEATDKGSEIFNLFNEITSEADENGDSLFKGITEEDFPQFLEMLYLVQNEFAQTADSTGELDELIYFVESIFALCSINKEATSRGNEDDFYENLIKFYYLSTYIDDTANRNDYCISLTCVSPLIAFHLIKSQNPRNLLLTSAALKPFDSFESELMIDFPIKFSNSHAIDSKVQCFTAIVTNSPSNFPLDFSAVNKNSIDLYTEMGVTMMRIAKFVPNGIVMCFPSYFMMKKCLRVWRNSEERIYKKLEKVKNLFEESKDTKRMSKMMKEYQEAAVGEKGAIFFCVARGKVCETANFSNEAARAIVFVGVPNLDLQDKKVDRKIRFLDHNQEQTQRMTGNAWYGQQTVRALTQAMGRVIRHQDDYGMIFLCDERFAGLKDALPSWARANCTVYGENDFILLKEDIREFLEDTPILIQERNQDLSCLIELKGAVQINPPVAKVDDDDEIIEEELVKEIEENIWDEKLVRQQEENFEEELVKQKEEDVDEENQEDSFIVDDIKPVKRKARKRKLVKQQEEDFEEENQDDSFIVDDIRPVKRKSQKRKLVKQQEENFEEENQEDSFIVDDIRPVKRKAQKRKLAKQKEEDFKEENQEDSFIVDDIRPVKRKAQKRKKGNKTNQNNDNDHLGGFAELSQLIVESQVIPTDILGKRTDRVEKIDFCDEVFVGKASTKGKEDKLEDIDNDPLGGLAELNKLVLESQVIPTDILGKRTDRFEKNDFSEDFLIGSQSTKKIKTEVENKENRSPFGGLAEESQVIPINILGSEDIMKGSQSKKNITMELEEENKEDQENNEYLSGGLTSVKKPLFESTVISKYILGKTTDKSEKNDLSKDLLKDSQSAKKIKTEFENLKPRKENYSIKINDVDKYFDSSAKSTEQSGKKNDFESLKPSKENYSIKINDIDKYSAKSTERSGTKSGKKSDFENLKPSKENHFIETNDVDKYFESSKKSANKSGTKSGKKTLQEILCQHFPFKPLENIGFAKENDSSNMFKTSIRKSLTKTPSKVDEE